MYATLFAAVASVFFMFALMRHQNNKAKPSVTDKYAYRELAIGPVLQSGSFLYENPANYERKCGKLVAISSQLQSQEKDLNSRFRDKIPWCLPPNFGDLEMKGSFPTAKDCRLEALCRMMKSNSMAFTSEFNEHKAMSVNNPEKLGYGNRYFRIDINEGDESMFPETRKILGSSLDYVRTQEFNKYANYNFLSTTFTVLYPGASIRPHFGPTNYKYRIHLCLDIDGVGGIVTAYGTKYWKVGDIFILDDSYLHAGFYEGTRPRVIIMVDIAKPGLKREHIDDMFATNSKIARKMLQHP